MSSTFKHRWIPVVSCTGKPLMPCHPARARKLLAKGKAVKRHRGGFFYLQLTQRRDGDVQPVVVGVDPGSMREAYTVMSAKRTFVNVQTHAANGKGIKKAMEGRANARRARRGRRTPCRAPRFSNRSRKGFLPPSTRARWQRKWNMVGFFHRLYPLTHVAIEDVSMPSKKGDKRHNAGFSPLMAGKNWLYGKLEAEGYEVAKYRGLETASFRQQLGLAKSKLKLSSLFSAHCVDSWVLANAALGGRAHVDYEKVIELIHHRFTRRQLHVFNPTKGGVRRRVGGTISLGLKRGTLARWKDKGLFFVGGNDGKACLSLHTCLSGARVTQTAKLSDVAAIAYFPWRYIDHAASGLSKPERRVRRLQRLCGRLRAAGIVDSRVEQRLASGTAVRV